VSCSSSGLQEPLAIHGDPQQLRIACLNLLRNAIEAVQDLPVEQRQVRIQLERLGDRACLMVADSGPGLSDALAGLLRKGSRKPAGMGLGLFIAHNVSQQHGGELQAGRSAELGGAELRLQLPCEP